MIHRELDLSDGELVLGEVGIDRVKQANPENNTDLDWERWRDRAATDPTVYYFGIFFQGKLVGEIFLHDINKAKKESLIGYHIFDPEMRGKGLGGLSLSLLKKFACDKLGLSRLIIITGKDNISSKKIAENNGFIFTGPSWEDPNRVVYEWNE